MFILKKSTFVLLMVSLLSFSFWGCSDEESGPEPTGNQKIYTLFSAANPAISGTATFQENDDASTTVILALNGTPAGGSHPAHIHTNTAAEGGGIALTFEPVDGSSGRSETVVRALDSGTSVTYAELLQFNGYINVHLSASELGTIVAQGDIGVNELTNESTTYPLGSVSNPSISGEAKFTERVNGSTLVEIMLQGTSTGSSHPAHIHNNTAAEGGGIALGLNPVLDGISKTQVSQKADETAITYQELIAYNGYINAHLSSENLAVLVAQGDIGQNALTGNSKEYVLDSVAEPTISGTATFFERVNGTTLVTLALVGTPDGGSHPAHIHDNTAAEGGGIAVGLTAVDGTSGMSKTQVRQKADGTAISYTELLDYNGYINVHVSSNDLATLVAQGDIGQNALTGNSKEYVLDSVAEPTISGTATFFERENGTTLVTIALVGTPDGGSHPAHIHDNSAAVGGGIAVGLTPVNGTTGMSKTQVSQKADETAISYSELLQYNGYINVHVSSDDLATLVAQGNIGSNVE